jgi:hypothetical protein
MNEMRLVDRRVPTNVRTNQNKSRYKKASFKKVNQAPTRRIAVMNSTPYK